ncbi:TolA protein [hydrothermal vent metagenome]|uniref:TolA protein n=1 Tax=hydrothermal vent metagenome TaxID=652676 RepID=A0A1W1C8E1_9ZZZZ
MIKKFTNLISKYKKKIRRFSMPVAMLLVSSTAQASACSKLAKIAGIGQSNLKVIVDKLVKIETTTGGYTVKNPRSGAYGKYQILPSTAKFYAKKLKIPKYLWKKPYNQDKIFRAIMKDNIKSLKRNGHRISAFSLYATHQQGAGGFNSIMKNKKMTRSLEKNLRQNLPKKLSKVKKSKLRLTWIRYWKNKLA